MSGSSDDRAVEPIFNGAFREALSRWTAPSLNVEAMTPELKAMAVLFLQQHRLQVSLDLWHQVASVVRDRLSVEHSAFLWLIEASQEEAIHYFRDPQPFVKRIQQTQGEVSDERVHYPPEGWLCNYLDYTAEHEAPALFHLWVGATVLSAALSRRVALNFDTFRVYPNLYTILVAPTGVCRKSTAINIGVSLLRAALQDDRVVLFGGKATPESIVKTIQQSTLDGQILRQWSHGFAACDELYHFLGRQRYNEGLISLLTTLYDCKDYDTVDTVGRGREALRNIYFVALFGSTPKWLRLSIPPEAQGAGFVPRFVLPTKMAPERIISRAQRPRHVFESLQGVLTRYLGELLNTKPRELTLAEQTHKARDEWYRADRQRPSSDTDDEVREGFATRRDVTILKVAEILALSIDPTVQTIELPLWERARRLVQYTESTMEPALRAVATEKPGELQQRILTQIIRRDGRLTHRQIHQFNSRVAKGPDIRIALQTLIAAGMIVEMHQPDHHYILVPQWRDKE